MQACSRYHKNAMRKCEKLPPRSLFLGRGTVLGKSVFRICDVICLLAIERIVIITNRRSQMSIFDNSTVSNVQARILIISNMASSQPPTALALLHSLHQTSPCTRNATFNRWTEHPTTPEPWRLWMKCSLLLGGVRDSGQRQAASMATAHLPQSPTPISFG